MLGRRISGVPALAVATFRDVADHPLRLVLGELATAAGVERIRVPPLSAEAVRELAEPHGIDGDDLHERTGGNPFYVTEVLSAPAATIPATVRDAVLARAAALSDGAREVLTRLSIVPGAAEPELIDADDDALDECVLSGMVRIDGHAIAFRHELARLAVEAEIPPRRRAALHRDVLRAPRGARCRPGATRPPRRGRGRRPGRAPPRDRGGGACRAARRAPPGGRAVRPRAALGGRHGGRRAGRAAREARLRVLPHRPDRGGDRGPRGVARATARAGRRCPRRRRAALAVAPALVRRSQRGVGGLRASPRSSSSRRCRPAPSWRWRTRTARSSRCCRPTCRQRSSGARGRSRWRSASATTRCWCTRSTTSAARSSATSLPGGEEKLRRSLELALAGGLEEHAARALLQPRRDGGAAAPSRRTDLFADGLAYCERHDLDSWRAYIVAWRAVAELNAGDYDAAAKAANDMLTHSRTAQITRIPALVALGLVRARRGDPGAMEPLDQALRAGTADRRAAAARAGGVGAGRGRVAVERPGPRA